MLHGTPQGPRISPALGLIGLPLQGPRAVTLTFIPGSSWVNLGMTFSPSENSSLAWREETMLTITVLVGVSLPSFLQTHSKLGQDCGSQSVQGLSETRTEVGIYVFKNLCN